MKPDATVSVALILGIISAIGVIVSIYLGLHKQHTEDDNRLVENAREFTKLNVKLDNFTATMNELVKKSERSVNEQKEMSVDLIRCSERIETLFKYKDDHERRLKKLEDESE